MIMTSQIYADLFSDTLHKVKDCKRKLSELTRENNVLKSKNNVLKSKLRKIESSIGHPFLIPLLEIFPPDVVKICCDYLPYWCPKCMQLYLGTICVNCLEPAGRFAEPSEDASSWLTKEDMICK